MKGNISQQTLVEFMPQTADRLRDSWGGFFLSRVGVIPIAFSLAKKVDRVSIVSVINEVAGERIYLQTDQYRPTEMWERLLEQGFNVDESLALFVVKYHEKVIGFGRLYPEDKQPLYGNVGIVLLKSFRSIGIGTALLKFLIDCATSLGYKKMTADVLATNVRSIRLFRRFQFMERDIHDFHPMYSSGNVREITFELDL
jgi:RimJ/RimL family protein N-acetyltransferase